MEEVEAVVLEKSEFENCQKVNTKSVFDFSVRQNFDAKNKIQVLVDPRSKF